MPTDTVSIAEFVKANRITLTAEWTDRNPNMEDTPGARMDHWKTVLKMGRNRMTVYFSKGIGHHGAEPTAEEVLDCLASDAATVANSQGFEDWASELGYDADSRKAERTWKAVVHQAARLNNFLGNTLYEQLLWNTERL